ncbi:MAG: FHA domain-containing protein [Alphaproteobacteria bacterium]|nr:FHA domain-containing protein [Alphaproteobacteria bacterium]
MAILHARAASTRIVLPPRALVGRAPGSEVHLPNPRVSGRHAELRWTVTEGWAVKDLGSRNGTLLNDLPLPPGAWHPLAQGATLAFGDADAAWVLRDAAPPALPMAQPLNGGPVIEAVAGELLLPDPDRPLACVRRLGDRWVIEGEEDPQPLPAAGPVTVAGVPYRLFLPEGLAPTIDVADQPLLGLLSFAFTVSRDEENVHLVARQGADALDLGVRVHHYMLLTLARQRLTDREAGVPSDEEGWVYRDDLMRMLGVDRVRLNMEIFRARRQLAAAGVHESGELIERRPGSQQLRLGIHALTVQQS